MGTPVPPQEWESRSDAAYRHITLAHVTATTTSTTITATTTKYQNAVD